MKEQIKEVLKRVLEVESVDNNISQATCENWDSLRHLNLIVELELEFNVEFEPEEISEMKNLEAIQEILQAKQ